MYKLGGMMFAMGILSFGLKYFDREFILLIWVDSWGPQIGNGIRIAMIVLGFIIMGMGYSEMEE